MCVPKLTLVWAISKSLLNNEYDRSPQAGRTRITSKFRVFPSDDPSQARVIEGWSNLAIYLGISTATAKATLSKRNAPILRYRYVKTFGKSAPVENQLVVVERIDPLKHKEL